MFKQVFKSKTGIIIISIVWGLALATLFQRVCKGRGCLIFNAPNVEEVRNNTYAHNNKCYRFKTESTSCENKQNIINHI